MLQTNNTDIELSIHKKRGHFTNETTPVKFTKQRVINRKDQ